MEKKEIKRCKIKDDFIHLKGEISLHGSLHLLKRTDVKPGVEHSFILPKKALNLLKATLSDDDSKVQIDYNTSNAYFTFGDVK